MPAVRPVGGTWVGARPRSGTRPARRGTAFALALLLGGYLVTGAMVAWMLAKGHPSHTAIQALAPISIVVALLVGIGSLAAVVFAGRRYVVIALTALGLSVGVAVAAFGALVTANF